MRRILVTGGGRGIGAATVEKFKALGDKVAFVYRSDDASARALFEKTGAYAIKADISDPEMAEKAVNEAVSGDIVLIAGKGHEDYQEIKGVKYHFDDKEVVSEIFNSLI